MTHPARPLAGLASLVALFGVVSLVGCPQKDIAVNPSDSDAACVSPTADAGLDGSGAPGRKYALDGSGSTVCDGTTPTYNWTVESVPTDSTIDAGDLRIIDPSKPEFSPDAVGAYVFSLTVADGAGTTSDPDLVVVNVTSSSGKPTANCGGNQAVEVGERVDLNGAGSSDPEGAALQYSWTLSAIPDCSDLSNSDVFNAGSATAQFVPDCASVFVVALAVSDGEMWSDPAYCAITVGSGNEAPVADAGSTEALSPCTEHHFELAGWGSYDPEGAAITYLWSVVSVPAGSTSSDASFNDATLPNPAFEWDVPGVYTFALQVNDGTQVSPPDVVVLTFHDVEENAMPIANAGEDETISHEPECTTASYTFACEDCPSDDVTLDGTASDDPVDGDDLQFKWTESTGGLTIESPNSASTRVITPSFPATRNVAETKTWTVGLSVSDCADSASDSVTVTYTCTGTYSP